MLRSIAVAVVVAALAAGCASDDSNASSATTAASPGTTAGSPDTTGTSDKTGTSDTTGTSAASGTLDWRPCKTQTRFDSAALDVPLDYSDPSGKTISLALIRKQAGDPSQRIGSLLMNPGGPGGSGVEFLPQVLFAIDSSISDRFDLVSFDPRGVGDSDPIVCLTDQQKDAYAAFDAVPTPAEIPTLEDLNKQFGASCKAKYGDELSHFGTVDAARDMDRIREAVGDDKLTYLGFSYGTRLGSVYAQLFPDKVRALALDGAVDPDPAATDFPAKQAEGFEQAFDAFAKDCDANPQCPAGPDAAGLYDQLLKQVDTKPIPAAHDSRVLTQGYLVSGAISALYAKELWSPLATGLRQAQQGDGSLLLQLADSLSGRANDGTWNNQWDINTAVNCLDDPARDTTPQVESLATDLEKTSPRFGAVIGWTNLTCTYWPVPPDPIPVATADGAPPIVVVGTTRDPATPYVWAERMASTLKSGVLITRDGDGHTGYIESPCVAQMVNDYLINLTVPPAKAFCAS